MVNRLDEMQRGVADAQAKAGQQQRSLALEAFRQQLSAATKKALGAEDSSTELAMPADIPALRQTTRSQPLAGLAALNRSFRSLAICNPPVPTIPPAFGLGRRNGPGSGSSTSTAPTRATRAA